MKVFDKLKKEKSPLVKPLTAPAKKTDSKKPSAKK